MGARAHDLVAYRLCWPEGPAGAAHRICRDVSGAYECAGASRSRLDSDSPSMSRFGRNRPIRQHRPLKTAAARREVILMSQLAGALRRRRLASPFSADSDLIFCTATGQTIGHRNLTARGLERAAKRAGLRGVTFHVLRHTFASILIAQGHDPVFVSRQLGHANAAITLKVYARLFDAERHADQARARLEADYGALLARH